MSPAETDHRSMLIIICRSRWTNRIKSAIQFLELPKSWLLKAINTRYDVSNFPATHPEWKKCFSSQMSERPFICVPASAPVRIQLLIAFQTLSIGLLVICMSIYHPHTLWIHRPSTTHNNTYGTLACNSINIAPVTAFAQFPMIATSSSTQFHSFRTFHTRITGTLVERTDAEKETRKRTRGDCLSQGNVPIVFQLQKEDKNVPDQLLQLQRRMATHWSTAHKRTSIPGESTMFTKSATQQELHTAPRPRVASSARQWDRRFAFLLPQLEKIGSSATLRSGFTGRGS